MRRLGLGREFPRVLAREAERFRKLRKRWPWRPPVPKPPIKLRRCLCAPLVELAWWNDGAQKQLQNNCYNYGSNYRTDTFHQIPGGSQPGAAAGAMYSSLTGPRCAPLHRDGRIHTLANNGAREKPLVASSSRRT